MRRQTLALAALLITSLVLPAQAKADRQRLEFWTQSLAPKFNGYFQGLVAQYNASQPNVEVVWIDYPWNVIRPKFTAAIAAGRPPALANMDVPWAYEYHLNGLIQPVDQLIDRQLYLPGALADVSYDGHTWAVPFYNGANVIAYNTALFKAAGLDPAKAPGTLDEQISIAKQIKAKTGVAGFAPTLGPTKLEGLLAQEGLDVIKNGRAVFNSPAHVALVQKLADAYRSGALLKDGLFAQDNFQLSMAAYSSGRMAMLVTVPAALGRVRDDAPTVYQNTAVAPVPLSPSGMAAGGWQFTYVVPKNVDAKLLPEIGKLASFLTNSANQLAFARQAGTLPTARAAAADPYFHQAPAKAGAAELALIAAVKNLHQVRTIYLSGVPDAELLSTKLSSAVEQAVTGRKDAKQALDEAVAFWNKKLSR
ncbi:extracellular solute-binding protein [Chitinimonas sp.]|uniref:extracellular solute-binding protein n=1 Tax=Chitinimonas sp. TaxID=1934313 RepID=UPI0035B42DE7